jgi:hypothetical protein
LAQARITKPAAKTISSKPQAQAVHPVKDTLTKLALINLISEQNGIPRDTAKGVFTTLENALWDQFIRVALANLHCQGC